ncbi:MAG: sigma-70 factor domain-containing protein, partial [Dehalococcoidia bacterium]
MGKDSKGKSNIEAHGNGAEPAASSKARRLRARLDREDSRDYSNAGDRTISSTGVLDLISGAKSLGQVVSPRVEKATKAVAVAADQDMVDDPVRMYLREIGRVRLLNAKDERILARKMEGGKYISSLEKELQDGY